MQAATRHGFEPVPAEVERVGKSVLDAAFKGHSTLGPGLLESVYEAALAHLLRQAGLGVETQVLLPVVFEGQQIEAGLRLDLRVGRVVIVELKAVENMIPLYQAQLMTYLRLTGIRLGYLINFNVARLRHGITRLVV